MAKEIPQMIAVGISYGGTLKGWWTKRSQDYTPTYYNWNNFTSMAGKYFL